MCLALASLTAQGLVPVRPPPVRVDRERAPSFRATVQLRVESSDRELIGWVASFSASHVGLSAARESFIENLGRAADEGGLVGTGLKLPSYWLGDGQEDIWPDISTAGRQLFRIGYTAVSFFTLGGAFSCYLANRDASGAVEALTSLGTGERAHAALVGLASVSNGIALSSLANPSPLSLVPGFSEDGGEQGVLRDDTLKLSPRGLTRITRHPLILPVVPWGFANAILVGGRYSDAALFIGLALYAVVGCYAQDLRAGSSTEVGTVFSGRNNEQRLSEFFKRTSFVPFVAVADGRQKLSDIASELPWAALAAGCTAGTAIEVAMLGFLGSW